MADTIETQVISAKGDILLDVGTPVTKRLRVSSKALMSASQSFLVLFGPSFSQRQLLQSSDAVNIAAPEDDGLAMTDMCMLIHGQ